MKKTAMALITVLLLALISWAGSREEQQYVNLNFIVWQLENGAAEAARRINTPIPEVFKESWICDFITLDVTSGKAATKVMKKGGLRFVLTAENKDRLTIQVYEKEKELFRLIYNRPSTVDTIFYGSDNKTYMIELTYTANNHPVGFLSPGILKK